jgi:hypothetical protein
MTGPQPSPSLARVRAALIASGWAVTAVQAPNGLTARSLYDGHTVNVHVHPAIDNADDGPRDGL